MSAILAFNESGNLPFRKVTPEFLKSFEAYLRGRNCSWNTVSTYMRTLRAVYNRAVDRRIAPYVPHHFRYVYTGTRADKKRALEKEDMERLMKDLPKQLHSGNRELQRARGFFILMFLLRGMPFVDLAYLKKHDIDGNVLTYRRRKTGRMLTVTLLPEAVKLIKQHMNTDPASPYLFSLISSKEGTEEAYKDNFIVVYRIGRETFVIVILRISRIVQSVRGTLLVILSDEIGCCLRCIRPVCGVAVRIVQFGSTVEQGSCL